MARLRLIAGIKEVAGIDTIEVDVSTVGGLVAEADGRFGSDFVRARSGAKLWLNDASEIDDLATPISRTDEVSIVPTSSTPTSKVVEPEALSSASKKRSSSSSVSRRAAKR